MNKSQLFWDKRSADYDRRAQKHNKNYFRALNKIKPLLTKSDKLLDFACATAEISFDLASSVKEVYGIDTSGKMIELAEEKKMRRGIENIRFARDIFSDELIEASYSIILAFNIFHLLENREAVIKRLYALLKDGGLLISETPCLKEKGWFFRLLIKFAASMNLVPFTHEFSYKNLVKLVSEGNFLIEENSLLDEKNVTLWILAKKI